jgi:acetyl-CoA synthetase
MWHQSDFGYVDPGGYWYLLGRSDDTMNVAGKRVGPAEVESAVVRDDDVVEAAAVGVPHDVKGEGLLVFVVLRDGVNLEDVTPRIRSLIRAELGPSIVPEDIFGLGELPKTRSGKVLRRVIRASYLGEPLGDLSSLDNASSIDGLPKGPRVSAE